jgi:hypothetical protein
MHAKSIHPMVILTPPIRHPFYGDIVSKARSINSGLIYFPPIGYSSAGFVYRSCSHYASASTQYTCYHTCIILCLNNIMFFLTYHKTQLNTMFFKTLSNNHFIIISHPTTHTVSQSTIHNYITINSS